MVRPSSDFAPNGLQVEGRETVHKIVTGVTACEALLDEAVRLQADAVIVHHGWLWKNESPVIHGMKRRRLKTLLANDINLYGWHLPLDAHPELGNNAQLAHLPGINVLGEIRPRWCRGASCRCRFPASNWPRGSKRDWGASRCGAAIPESGHRQPRCLVYRRRPEGFIDAAARFGVDAFITGEVSGQTIHSAREQGLHFYAAGHHATERGGIRALSEWLTETTRLDVTFIDIPNPCLTGEKKVQRARCYLLGETAVVTELEPPVTLESQKRIWGLTRSG